MKEPSGSSAVADLCSSPHFIVTRPNRTTVKVFYDPKNAPLYSSFPSMEGLREDVSHLTIETHGGRLEVNDRAVFGTFLHDALPNVTSIQYRTSVPAGEEDELLLLLSQYPPPKLSALTISYLHYGDYQNFYLGDKPSFPNLKSMTIRVANFYAPTKRAAFSNTYFQSLGHFLATSNNLQEVSLCNVTTTAESNQGKTDNNTSKSVWSPVIDALRGNPGLQTISLTHRHGYTLYPYNDLETMESVQFGPRIQHAKTFLMEDNVTQDPMQASREQWMKALLSVRERSDCVEYFLSHYPAESIRSVQEILERGL